MGSKSIKLGEITAGVVEEYRGIYGERLRSIVLYGKGARAGAGDKVDVSDVNFLAVLDSKGILDLEDSFAAVKRWAKKGIAPPLFLTEEYIRGALDSYPIEFLEMQSAYKVLHGDDPIGELRIERAAVRLQAERDARAYLLKLRQRYLAGAGRARPLRALVAESLPGFHNIFRALRWLLTGERGGAGGELSRWACDRFELNAEVFDELLEVSRGARRRGGELLRLADSYLEEARKLVIRIDRLEENGTEEKHG